jgi:SPFH domain / Band 7 family
LLRELLPELRPAPTLNTCGCCARRCTPRPRPHTLLTSTASQPCPLTWQVSGNLYVQFTDAEKAAYGSTNPLYSVRQFAQSSMRSAIGELELDEILHARAKLNKMIGVHVQEAAMAWGLSVKR